jgi:hypothetical protein
MTDEEWKDWLRRLDKPKTRALPAYKYGDPAGWVKFERERGRKMKREFDEVEVLLDLWAEWMHRPEPVIGCKVASGFITSAGDDSEEVYEANEMERIKAIDAAFDSLAPLYKEAIRRKYKLGAQVFRFGKDVSFEDAKVVFRVKLVMKGLL